MHVGMMCTVRMSSRANRWSWVHDIPLHLPLFSAGLETAAVLFNASCPRPMLLHAHDSTAIPSLIHPLFCSPQVSIFAYSDVVCRRVSDVVPKQVHYFLVNSLCDGLVRSMLQKATRADLEAWFAEGTKTLSRRKAITHKLSQFKQGVEILEIARSMK